jgi:uncharacterized membrane protein YphA (DoxX/SURF4 family)
MNMKVIGYWTATTIIVLELLAGGITELVHGPTLLVVGDPVVQVIAHLGYPVYLLTILGWWKLLGAIVLLVPRFPRLKEWAYAGAFFNMTGAAASGALRGDSVGDFIWPLLMAVLVLVSWALRPQSRTLGVLWPIKIHVQAHHSP